MTPQETTKLDALDVVLRKVGHDPIPYLRPEARRLDAFRCRACHYIKRVTPNGLDEERVPPCMIGPALREESKE